MSRAEVARHLGLTKSAVRYIESRGELHATVTGAKGEAWFERGDVIAFAAKRQRRKPGRLTQGAVEAAAMILFEAHAKAGSIARCVPEVMIATLLPATEVIRLRAIFVAERAITLPARAEVLPIDEGAREAREERASADAQTDFEREMAARRRALDDASSNDDDKDEDDEEDAERRRRRKRR
jgi:hypothetical protein